MTKLATTFLVAGVAVTGILFLLMGTTVSGLSGWGDGAHDSNISSPPGLILPYSSYFLCGFIAACLAKRWARILLAVVAHSAPFASQEFARHNDGPIFIGIDIVTFLVFAFAWIQMFGKDYRAA